MTWTALCADCGWTYAADMLEPDADALEQHAQKDHHHVTLHRRPMAAPYQHVIGVTRVGQ